MNFVYFPDLKDGIFIRIDLTEIFTKKDISSLLVHLLGSQITSHYWQAEPEELYHSFEWQRHCCQQKILAKGYLQYKNCDEKPEICFWLQYQWQHPFWHFLDRFVFRICIYFYLLWLFSLYFVAQQERVPVVWLRFRIRLQWLLRGFLAAIWIFPFWNNGLLYTSYPMLQFFADWNMVGVDSNWLVDAQVIFGLLLLFLPENRVVPLLSMFLQLPLIWSLVWYSKFLGVFVDLSFFLYSTIFFLSFLLVVNSRGLPSIFRIRQNYTC